MATGPNKELNEVREAILNLTSTISDILEKAQKNLARIHSTQYAELRRMQAQLIQMGKVSKSNVDLSKKYLNQVEHDLTKLLETNRELKHAQANVKTSQVVNDVNTVSKKRPGSY